jgi:hypothetical protein
VGVGNNVGESLNTNITDQTDVVILTWIRVCLRHNPINCCVYVEGRIDENAASRLRELKTRTGWRHEINFRECFHHLDADDFNI